MPKKTFFCIDAHTCGNPVRLVAGGGPLLQGSNMSEKRQHFLKDHDWIRKGLISPKHPGKIRLETPAGLVLINYTIKTTAAGIKVSSVQLTNVPAYLAA